MKDFRLLGRRFESALFYCLKVIGCFRGLRALGPHTFISPFSSLTGCSSISIGDRAHICSGTQILAISSYGSETFSPDIVIEDQVYIGNRCTIAADTRLRIGARTVFGDGVYVGGAQHGYNDPSRSVIEQELVAVSVDIGSNCWIGYSAFIGSMKPIAIGDGAIVAAGAVITESVAPYTMVAGNPARPVRRYNAALQRWERLPE